MKRKRIWQLFVQHGEFWALHYVGWTIVWLFYLTLSPLVNLPLLPTLMGLVVYTFCSTACCAVLNHVYEKQAWSSLPLGQQIPRVFAFAIPSAVVFSSILASAIHGLGIDTYGESMAKFDGLSEQSRFYLTLANNAFTFMVAMVTCGLLKVGVSSYKNARSIAVRTAQVERDLKEAKINALAGQLRPHFLFNALNNIRFAMGESVDQAQEMIVGLSEILRYSLNVNEGDRTTVADELHIVDRYISLVKLQYEDKLRYTKSVNPASLDCQIPPMMVQLLVENAIKHGIDSHYREGTVSVSIDVRDENLLVEVCNDSTKKLREKTCSSHDEGVGIRNIKNRLELLYGIQAEFDIRQREAWTTAYLKLPLEKLL